MNYLCAFGRGGEEVPLTPLTWCDENGFPLSLPLQPAASSDNILDSERSLWRYHASIPVAFESRVSMGEGWTPMIQKQWSGAQPYFKLEWFNPTSSFKDRGVSVMVSYLKAIGATRILEDSSGNGGSSVSAFGAAAGLATKIICPESTSEAKQFQMKAFGAEVELVAGTRDQVAAEAVRQAKTIAYSSHNWHPMFLQGVKTVAYEIWEMLGFQVPDNIVVVSGSGSLILGCDIAFSELEREELITKRPRLFVGQPTDWAPIVAKINGTADVPDSARKPTVAEGAAIARPVRGDAVAAAVRNSGGRGVSVTEEQISTGCRRLCGLGLFAEPTSAVAAAAFDKLLRDGTIAPTEDTVVILTGTALKSMEKMSTLF